MPAPIIPAIPVTPWKLYPDVSDIPTKGFKKIEVEAIAIEKDLGGKVYCTRLVFSPEDGPLKMCSVYLRGEDGGAVCIADLPTKEEAILYSAQVRAERGWPVTGGIWELMIREVPGKGYIADPREHNTFTFDPAKAALYHFEIAKDDLFAGGPGEHGRWMSFHDASNHALDRAAEKEALIGRVFSAALVAMGTSAPVAGSLEATRMQEMLKEVVEANRSDRLVIFDDVQRELICETLDEGRFDLAGHESDEDLCNLILSASPHDLFSHMEPEFERDLLKAFASEAGVVAIKGVVDRSQLAREAPMFMSIHRRLERQDIESPVAHHFAESESESAPAPRG